MGGTIGFNTVTGQGTTFYFELPQAGQAPPLPLIPTPADTVRNLVPPFASHPPAAPLRTALPRILHVEDDSDLSSVIGTALAGKAEVVTARTLQEAERLLNETSFSVLVMAGRSHDRQVARFGGAHRADDSVTSAQGASVRIPCPAGADF